MPSSSKTSYLVYLVALALLALSALSANAAPTATRYVAPSCSNVPTPCHTTIQAAVDAATSGDTIKIASAIYTGQQTKTSTAGNDYRQVVYIDKNLTLDGGYQPPDWTTPAPQSSPSVIDAQNDGRGVSIVGTFSESVTLRGLTIRNGDYDGYGNAAGMFNVCRRTGADCGGGLFVFQAQIKLEQCVVENNVATQSSASSDGGGVYFWDVSAESHIHNCLIRNNSTPLGHGGGASIIEGNSVNIHDTDFRNNTATQGGGLFLSQPDAKVTMQRIGFYDNKVTVDDNNSGGGMAALLIAEDALFMNRVTFMRNEAVDDGAALSIRRDGGNPPVAAELHNLLFAENRLTNADATGSTILVLGATDDFNVTMKHVTAANNDGNNTFMRVLAPRGQHPLTVNMTNVLLANYSYVFSTYQEGLLEGDIIINHDHTLTHDVANLHIAEFGTAQINTTNGVTGDPELDANYRLRSGSAAINAGVAAGVMDDIDGDERPRGGGYDIGADEANTPKIFIPMVVIP